MSSIDISITWVNIERKRMYDKKNSPKIIHHHAVFDRMTTIRVVDRKFHIYYKENKSMPLTLVMFYFCY